MALIEVRLRPTTPWRVGHGAGDRERVDVVYHSDALYSAITHAMKTLGWLEEWLAATAQSDAAPAVRFSSLFPFIGKTRLVAPPKTWWPPANSGRLYTKAAKLIPLEVVRNGIVDESRWVVDGETGCMFHTGATAPVQIAVRTSAAIDRLTGVADPHRIACLEFAPNAGWWGVFSVEEEGCDVWDTRVKSAFRLLADSGFGGERSRGWGRAATPEFSDASSLLPTRANDEGAWWLLSMYSPHASDEVDWTRGEYAATQRGGWTDSQSGVAPKKQVRVVEEGSVLFAASLRGRAVDVAPDGFPHPVYRAGFALAVPCPAEPAARQAVTPLPAPAIEPEPTPTVVTDSAATAPEESATSEPAPQAEPQPSPAPATEHAAAPDDEPGPAPAAEFERPSPATATEPVATAPDEHASAEPAPTTEPESTPAPAESAPATELEPAPAPEPALATEPTPAPVSESAATLDDQLAPAEPIPATEEQS